MYPNLTVPLVVMVLSIAFVLAVLLVRKPVLRRLALRQVARRPTEALLVVCGSVLGTAIIVGALVVGDTLGHSVRQEAYTSLGPIDERVVTPSPAAGNLVATEIASHAASTPDIDGVLSGRVTQAAASTGSGGGVRAEPGVLAWDVRFGAAASFGGSGAAGLSGPAPRPGHVVLNQPLATSLDAAAGSQVTLYLRGTPHVFTVDRVVPARGLAGAGLGAAVNRNAFLPPGSLLNASELGDGGLRWFTLVSNRGGVEGGAPLTDQVVTEIRGALGSLADSVAIETPKQEVLHAADVTAAMLGALFLMIGSFSIIAGALLLVNIFVMLGEERKGQLGMLRAVGLRRSRLVGSFTLEGAVYAAAATAVGVLVGVGVGYAVSVVAARIFSSWSSDGTGLQVSFAVSGTSLINGAALGLLIALVTVFLTSVRISRFNVIAAIRDLPSQQSPRNRTRVLRASAVATIAFGLLSVPAVLASSPVLTFVLPSLTMLCSVPLLRSAWSARAAYTAAAGGMLLWNLLAIAVRPGVFDTPSMAVYVVQGSLVAFSAVVLVSENQSVLLRPFRSFIDRPSEDGLALRLAVAYPLAKRFRTGATLVMYTLIVLVLVLLTTITGIFGTSMERAVADATAGYGIRLDYNPGQSRPLLADLNREAAGLGVTQVVPLQTARGLASDPGHRTTDPLETLVVGIPAGSMTKLAFDKRLDSAPTDAAVWALIDRDPRYVAIDQFFGHTGGPAGQFYAPGDTFVVRNPVTGTTQRKVIAGILRSATMFYAPGSASTAAFPLITSRRALDQQFSSSAVTSSALLRLGAGTPASNVATRLQGRYLASSVVATPIAVTVHRMFAGNQSFFDLMRGFLALGLLVGITGLGVVMVRAVRERRRTIGVLRALGFKARTIERSFLAESTFIALEGVVLGVVLGLLTTWLMYTRSAAFNGLEGSFPIMWRSIGLTAAVTLVASFLATWGPARRAARILPALAVRVSD